MQENGFALAEGASLQNLVERIDRLIRVMPIAKMSLDDQLWELKDIAEWFKLSVPTVYRFVVTRVDFPVPIQPCGSDSAQKRWFVGEVVKWGRLNQSKLPQPRRGRPRGQ